MQGLCHVNRGKCFGSCPLFDADENPADAQALTDVTLGVLPRDVLQHLIYNDAELALCLMNIYNDRMGLLARLGESLGTWTVGMRINDTLIAYAQNAEDGKHIVNLTHEAIANLVGTAREVVTRHLQELEIGEIISTAPSMITIHNLNGLKEPCIGDALNVT